MTVNKSQLVSRIFERNPDIKRVDIDFIVTEAIEEMKNSLFNNEKVNLKNFGTFEKKSVKETIKRNPRTNEKVTVSGHDKIYFKCSKNFF